MRFFVLLVTVALVFAADNSWDYILYVREWPGTNAYNKVVPKNVTDFTVHGLWPQRNDGTWPQFCTNEKFDPKQITDLVGALDKYWWDDQGDPFGFWSHEWEKHGTCASQVNYLKTQHLFFAQAITFAKQFPLLSILQQGGIQPSKKGTVSSDDIANAVRKYYGYIPGVECTSVSGLGVALWRITQCYDKTGQIQDCPNNAIQAECPAQIYFPSIQYN